MSWFRSAALYLVITAILLGAVWLFWGKDIENAWKKTRENPVVKDKIPKEITKKKADLKKVELPKLTAPLAAAEKLPADAAAEWQKTRSGAMGLVEAQKHENQRDLQTLAAKNDNRMIEILKAVRLYKDPKPTAVPVASPAPTPQAPAKAAAAPKKEKAKEKKKAALQPML